MAIQVKELREWLEGLKATDTVSIDEGGIILQQTGNRAHYIEVGGDPTEAEFEEDEDRRVRKTFFTPFDQHAERIGYPFIIIGPVSKDKVDEGIELYVIQFEDGSQIEAWPEEIFE